MNISQAVARVYAEALVDLSVVQDSLGRVVDDLHEIQDLFDSDATFRSFFSTHRIERAEKKRILNEVFKDKLDRPVLGLLNVLVDRQRELALDNIVDEFERHKDVREGRMHAYVQTARKLEDDQRSEIVRRLEGLTGKTIVLHERVEPELIGGIVLKLQDKVIDGTVRRRLERLKRALVAAGR